MGAAPGATPGLLFVPEPGHRAAPRHLFTGILPRHGRRFPASRLLHLHHRGPGRGQGLRRPDPQTMPAHPARHAGRLRPLGDDRPDRARTQPTPHLSALGQRPEQRPRLHAGGGQPGLHPLYGRLAESTIGMSGGSRWACSSRHLTRRLLPFGHSCPIVAGSKAGNSLSG